MVASSSHCTKFTQTTLMNCRQLKHTTTLWENVLRRHGKLKFVNNGDLNDKSRTRKNRLRVELKVGLWNCQQMKAYNDALEHKETYGIANVKLKFINTEDINDKTKTRSIYTIITKSILLIKSNIITNLFYSLSQT
ncbi:hypothetical protein PS2_025919 [Malus domestica]|uniref:Uncharacterized protein n=1 Tax=Malus domestica TaxID=3750 RepID=A0A498KJH2_MALDO|nr:hypothetical protein DVH24_017794 [Malus domestica]